MSYFFSQRQISAFWCLGLLLSLTVTPSVGASPAVSQWWGTVTWVVDGDTIRVRPLVGHGAPIAVRLNGVDAPEICQKGGRKAREVLERQLKGQQVLVYTEAHDRYGRVLARLDINGQDPAANLVRQGWAWSYQYRTGNGPYALQQRSAETRRAGLFATIAPEKPAAFRRRHGTCFSTPRAKS